MASAARKTVEVDNEVFADELKPGTQLLHGQFTIESFLNSGGFGITYLARDSLDRQVVIKECFPSSFCRRSKTIVGARSRAHQVEFRSIVKLFVQEAFNLSKLKHPQIVGVHQVFEDNDTAYMAMDYIEGFDLLETLEEGATRLSSAEIVGVLQKILGAVGFVHSRGVLHRDISPDNILMDKASGNPVLIDFGAAREEVSKVSRALSAIRVVKDGYSPQEFYINGSTQGPFSDLYALAATFYHLITGKTPANSQTRLSAVASGDADPYAPLSGHVTGFPPAFLKAMDKAMNVFPKDRIQSADAWLAMIAPGAEAADQPVTTARQASKRPVSEKVVVHAAPVPRPPKALLIGSAAAFAVMAGLAVWQGGLAGKATEPPAPASAAVAVMEKPDAVETAAVNPDGKPVAPVVETVVATTDVSAPDAAIKGGDAADALPADGASGDAVVTSPADAAAPSLQAEAVEPPRLDAVTAPTEEVAAAPVTVGAGMAAVEVAAADPIAPATEVSAVDLAVADTTPAVAAPQPGVVADPAAVRPSEDLAAAEPAKMTPVISDKITLARAVSMPFGSDDWQKNLIASIQPGAPMWMQAGQRIVEVNGLPLRGSDDLRQAMGRGSDLGALTEVQVVFGVQAFEGADIIRKTEVLPVIDHLILDTGLAFEVRVADGGVQTVVTDVPVGSDADLQVGDVLIVYSATQEKIDAATTLATILSREIERKVATYRFAVKRDGGMIVAAFTLTVAD